MYLELDVAEAVGRYASADLNEEAYSAFASRIVSQAYLQHADFIAGLAAGPSRRGWQQLARVQMVPRRGNDAVQRFAAVVQAQRLTVFFFFFFEGGALTPETWGISRSVGRPKPRSIMTDEAAKQQRERACDSKMGHAVTGVVRRFCFLLVLCVYVCSVCRCESR
jgi:hypothetical protein